VTLPRLASTAALAFAFALFFAHLPGLFIWIGATLTALLLGTWLARSLSGLTGDSYGAIEEVTETVSLVVSLFFL
jgi:adenosylcobinamide-GDP ribazoletransferase